MRSFKAAVWKKEKKVKDRGKRRENEEGSVTRIRWEKKETSGQHVLT